ncbi:MAG: ABC transporter substrate-binding protein [Acidobacteriota bacterium]
MIRRITLLAALPLLLIFVACPPPANTEFGAALPLTGAAAVYGNSLKNGAEVAIEVINAKGDPEIPALTLRVEDSASTPEGAKAALETVFSSSLAAIGGVTSDTALAAVEVADSADKVLLSPTASSPSLKRASRNLFLLFPSVQDEAVTMGRFLTDTLGRKSAGALAEDSAFGAAASTAFEEVFAGEFVGSRSFTADNVAAMAAELKEAGAQGVYVGAQGDQLIAASQAAKAAGLEVYATSALASPAIITAAGAGAEGAFFTETEFDKDSEDPQIVEFVTAYEAKFGSKPDLYAAYGFDSVLVMAEAYKETGGVTVPSDFAKGMRALSNFPGVTGNIQFREDGSVQKFNRVYFIADGEAVDYQSWRKAREDEFKRKQQELTKKMEAMRRRQQSN